MQIHKYSVYEKTSPGMSIHKGIVDAPLDSLAIQYASEEYDVPVENINVVREDEPEELPPFQSGLSCPACSELMYWLTPGPQVTFDVKTGRLDTAYSALICHKCGHRQIGQVYINARSIWHNV